MKILAIVVTYNAMQWADRCFGSLFLSSVEPDVYVVDNGSTDGTQSYIEERFPKIIFHQSDKNLGFGKANNLGLQYALDNQYDYVYLLNQDAWVMPDTFEKLIKISEENPEYGILSPFQMNADLRHIDKNFVAGVCSWYSNRELFTDIYMGEVRKIYDVPVVMAAHWFITRRCIEIAGGFSPSFVHYSEDDNYCDRLCYHKIRVGIVPSLKVVHDSSERALSKIRMVYLSYTNTIRIISNPNNKKYDNIIWCILYIIKYVLNSIKEYNSLLPFKYGAILITNLGRISRNRVVSIKETKSFLNQ